jgi:hypothetical protein
MRCCHVGFYGVLFSCSILVAESLAADSFRSYPSFVNCRPESVQAVASVYQVRLPRNASRSKQLAPTRLVNPRQYSDVATVIVEPVVSTPPLATGFYNSNRYGRRPARLMQWRSRTTGSC